MAVLPPPNKNMAPLEKKSQRSFSSFLKRMTKSKTLKSNRGAALLMSIFILNLVLFLALEVSNQSINEYLASSVEIKKVQSYHAARACYQLALLRVKAYQTATAQANALLGGNKLPPAIAQQAAAQLDQLNRIWKFPLAWPLPLPPEISSFDKSQFSSAAGASLLKKEFAMDITPESARIDINDLGSPSKALRERTRRQIPVSYTHLTLPTKA